jgi:murein DD-endopeptidase MepM/ murein hydrolase activator NlpD
MHPPAALLRLSFPRQLAVVLVISGALAACSSESNRFTDSPFSNPFASKSAPASDVTGSVSAQRPASASRIETQPLPPQTAAPPPTRPAQVSHAQPPRTNSRPAPDVTGSVANRPQSATQPATGNWDWNGGTAITVAPGETIEAIAQRHGVPSSALAQANGLMPNAQLYPGQRIVVPRYVYSAPAPATRPASPAASTTAAAQNHVHIVEPGETLTTIAKRYRKSLTEIATANNIPPYKMVRMGDRIVIPGVRASAPSAQAAPQPAPATPQRPAQQQAAAVESTNSAHVITPVAEPQNNGKAASEPMGSNLRWPARGRIIQGFGPKVGGQQNDGINIALPEGTAIKAADDGIVAYAGNELKGYGNLVLVRHSNGFVTAYAHASELLVKRGEHVKRGQVIAKSGQTGNVTSPQLHFEVRRGSTPVDPMQYLAGAT